MLTGSLEHILFRAVLHVNNPFSYTGPVCFKLETMHLIRLKRYDGFVEMLMIQY
jgi:hypothetical protein